MLMLGMRPGSKELHFRHRTAKLWKRIKRCGSRPYHNVLQLPAVALHMEGGTLEA